MRRFHVKLVVMFEDQDRVLERETTMPFIPTGGDVIVDDAADLPMNVAYAAWEIGGQIIEVHLDAPEDGSPEALLKTGWRET